MTAVGTVPPSENQEEIKKLQDLGVGQWFRFPWVSFEDALQGKDEACFFMVIDKKPKQPGYVSIIGTNGKHLQEKDGHCFVIPNQVKNVVKKNAIVEKHEA